MTYTFFVFISYMLLRYDLYFICVTIVAEKYL